MKIFLLLILCTATISLSMTGCSDNSGSGNANLAVQYRDYAESCINGGDTEAAKKALEEGYGITSDPQLKKMLDGLEAESSEADSNPLESSEQSSEPVSSIAESIAEPSSEAQLEPVSQAESIDYVSYLKEWKTPGASWYAGGDMLTIKQLNSETAVVDYNVIQMPPANRVAQCSDINCSVSGNKIKGYYSNDGWGSSGYITITLKKNRIEVETEETYHDSTAYWGFSSNKSTLY